MSGWLATTSHDFAGQSATWFVGVVLTLMSLFSGRLAETIKFALNRADLRTQYYEQIATDISHFVFIVDRLVKVYFGSTWASDEDRGAIAAEYNETLNNISRKEYVYLSWLSHYWRRKMIGGFEQLMATIREVDSVLITLNESKEGSRDVAAIAKVHEKLRNVAHSFLTTIS